ncbi:MAG: phosphopantetheine adenylyltransferase [Nitrososphaeria archaeon]
MNRKNIFNQVVVGGTFDFIHLGHLNLLNTAFSIGKRVIIGVSSDYLVKEMGKVVEHNFNERKRNLNLIIKKIKRYKSRYFRIIQLNDRFGPALDPQTDAIVVSEETETVAEECNKIRLAIGLKALSKVVVPIIYSENGERISSTRIRNKEIDSRGKLCVEGQKDTFRQHF